MSAVPSAFRSVENRFSGIRESPRPSPFVIPPSKPPARLLDRRNLRAALSYEISSCTSLPYDPAARIPRSNLHALHRLHAHQSLRQPPIQTSHPTGALRPPAPPETLCATISNTPPHRIPGLQRRVHFRFHLFLHRGVHAPQRRIQIPAHRAYLFPFSPRAPAAHALLESRGSRSPSQNSFSSSFANAPARHSRRRFPAPKPAPAHTAHHEN